MTSQTLLASSEALRRRPDEVTIFSGAGISAPGPTALPLGVPLTLEVLDRSFEPLTLDTVRHYHRLVGWVDSDGAPMLPRLETVLGVAVDTHGEEAWAVLEPLRDAPPNSIHRLCAGHLAAGGAHITANFDLCIEAALEELTPRTAHPQILHFHGAFEPTLGFANLGATLSRIEAGFSPELSRRFLELLDRPATLVVGYSGSDFFDVDQVIASLPAGALQGRSVLWVDHAEEPRLQEPGWAPCVLVSLLRQKGADVTVVQCPTEEALALVADAWRLPWEPALPTAARARPPAPRLADLRSIATVRLYSRLGIPAEVARLLASDRLSALPPAERFQLEQDLRWEQGRWRDARRAWKADGGRFADASRVAERIGACLWAEGRLTRAALRVEWTRHCYRKAPVDPQLAETLGRVAEHMRRMPDTKLLGRLVARRAQGLLPRPERRDGVHLFRRVLDVRSSLKSLAGSSPRAAGLADETSTWFRETGMVNAAMHYRHRELRDVAGGERPSPELAARYRDHQRRLGLIGSTGPMARVATLPHAAAVFSRGEVIAMAHSVQLSRWMKFRFLANDMLARARLGLQTGSGEHADVARRAARALSGQREVRR